MQRYIVLSCSLAAVADILSACTVSPTLGWVYQPEESLVWGLTVNNTNDGGFIVGGGYNSQYSMYALKLSATGALDWDMAYSNLSAGGSHGELWRCPAYGLLQTADGGYMIVGSGKLDNITTPDKSYLLVKTGPSGEVASSKVYAPVNPYVAGQLCINNEAGTLDITSDGGYFVAGSSYVGGYDLASVLKTKANGDVEFLKVINDNAKAYNQIITGGQQTFDGNYILTGYSDNGSPRGYLALLIKLDESGEPLFSKTYRYVPGGYGAIAYAIAETLDAGYVIGGDLVNDIGKALNHGPWLAKFDIDGNLLWELTLPVEYNLFTPAAIEETPQGDLLVGGKDRTGTMAIAKLNAEGGQIWTFTLPAELPKASVNDITLTEDGGCVVVGSGISSGTLVAKIANVFTVADAAR